LTRPWLASDFQSLFPGSQARYQGRIDKASEKRQGHNDFFGQTWHDSCNISLDTRAGAYKSPKGARKDQAIKWINYK